jgi:glutamate synthase (NADPH) small chain
MGKATGFLEYEREEAGHRPVADRIRDYREFAVHLPLERVELQGARCMDCGVPYCHSVGCPVFNLIPEWNDLTYRGDWREALARLEMTNNLPEITGRVCPAPCEAACTMAINGSPITIKQIELAIIEHGFEKGWVVPRPPVRETGRRVAVVGSGPAGLSAAQQLRRLGHMVTVYEKHHKLGGIMRYGIPAYKLEKWVIDRRIDQMRAEGVEFETGVAVGEDVSARYLRQRHDAILLTLGAGQPRDLDVAGRELDGVHFAMDYLGQSNARVAGDPYVGPDIDARDKVVLVIGGGDTGSDCVGTARRQGAKAIHQFEILPKPREWTDAHNPDWPRWPAILRTSSSHEEGCERRWSVTTKQLTGRGARVGQAHGAEVRWEGPARAARPVEVPGSDFAIDVDLVLIAMGFLHVEHTKLLDDLGVGFDSRNHLLTNGYRTTVDGVFAAGDAATGASLVVAGIWNGRQAARSIDDSLG